MSEPIKLNNIARPEMGTDRAGKPCATPKPYDDSISYPVEIFDSVINNDFEYQDRHFINQSFLKNVNKYGPMVAIHKRDNPDEPTTAMKVGLAFHARVLEGEETYRHKFKVLPANLDRGKAEDKAIYNALLEEAKAHGATLLTSDEHFLAMRMAEVALLAFGDTLLAKSQKEVIIVSDVPWFKCRLDGLLLSADGTRAHIFDFKTMPDLSNVEGSSYAGGWALQSAFYTDMVSKLPGVEKVTFSFIPVSKADGPADIDEYFVSDEMLMKGRIQYIEAYNKFKHYESITKMAGGICDEYANLHFKAGRKYLYG